MIGVLERRPQRGEDGIEGWMGFNEQENWI